MPAAVFAFQDLNRRLRQLRGEATTGTRYERQDDGSHKSVVDHDWSLGGICSACDFRVEDVQDGLVPKQCSGVKPKGAECFHVQRLRMEGITREFWRHPDGSRLDLRSDAPLAVLNHFREWRQYGKAGNHSVQRRTLASVPIVFKQPCVRIPI